MRIGKSGKNQQIYGWFGNGNTDFPSFCQITYLFKNVILVKESGSDEGLPKKRKKERNNIQVKMNEFAVTKGDVTYNLPVKWTISHINQ